MMFQKRGASRDRTPMRATLAATALAVGLCVTSTAAAWTQQAPSTVAAPVAAASSPQPALWVVRDADSTIYLFGTVHFLRPSTPWESPALAAAFDSADQLILEVADPNDQGAVVPLIQQYGLSPDTPLSSLLTAAEMASLDEAARAVGAASAQMEQFRPWLAGVMLSASALVRAGYQPGSGVDLMLRSRAVQAGKTVAGLETAEDQIRMLAGFSEEGQLSFLRRTLEEFDNALTVPDRLVDAWAAGDIQAVHDLAVAPMRQDSELVYQRVLVERNTRWADHIETLLEGAGTTFVAVGVLHLVGEDGVPAILASRGADVAGPDQP